MAAVESTWRAVYDGNNTYYYDTKTRETAWVLPEGAVAKEVIRTKDSTQQAAEVVEEMKTEDVAEADTGAAEEDESSWVVRVHPDSGQVRRV